MMYGKNPSACFPPCFSRLLIQDFSSNTRSGHANNSLPFTSFCVLQWSCKASSPLVSHIVNLRTVLALTRKFLLAMFWAFVGDFPPTSFLGLMSEVFGIYSDSDSSSLAAFSVSSDYVLQFLSGILLQ